MVSRRIFLKVALFLRGNGQVTSVDRYGHTPYTDMLRMAVLECDILRDMALARMMSNAALYGNSAADVDKGVEAVRAHFDEVLTYVPYLKQAAAGVKSGIEAERAAAIERYRQWRDKQVTGAQ